MARPTTDIGIINMGFDLIKETPITTIERQQDKKSAFAARWFPAILEKNMSAYNWNFNLKSYAIQRNGTPSISSYADSYMFPNDYLKLRAIGNPETPLNRLQFEIQGRNLFYNNGGDASLDIWYSALVTEVAAYPMHFILLVATEFAIVAARKFPARGSIVADLKNDLQDLRSQARGMDGQIRPPRVYESSRIVNAGLNPTGTIGVAGDYEFPEGMDA